MIPTFILVIEDLDDREFMSQLFLDFHRLMCHEARKIAKNDWIAEDIVQDTLLKLIDKVSLLRTLPQRKLVNYIISAIKNTTSLNEQIHNLHKSQAALFEGGGICEANDGGSSKECVGHR